MSRHFWFEIISVVCVVILAVIGNFRVTVFLTTAVAIVLIASTTFVAFALFFPFLS